jgi:hypothetical protein
MSAGKWLFPLLYLLLTIDKAGDIRVTIVTQAVPILLQVAGWWVAFKPVEEVIADVHRERDKRESTYFEDR